MRRKIIHIVLLCFCTTNAFAQYRFNHPIDITVEDGLPHEWVYGFAEDKYGFIWIGTYGGLCRYDGTNVLVFGNNEKETSGLPSNSIASLLMVGDTLWVGTFEGAAFMNIEDGKVTNFPVEIKEAASYNDKTRNAVRNIYQDRQGNIWLSKGYAGFIKIDKHTHEITRYPLSVSDKIPKIHDTYQQTTLAKTVQDINDDAIMWGISHADLVKLDTRTGKIERFRHYHKNAELEYNLNRYLDIYQHPDGNLYLGIRSNGISIFNPENQSFKAPFIDTPKDWPSNLIGESIDNITPKNDRELYLSLTTGIYLYNTESQSIRLIKKNITNQYQVQQYGINFIDSKNRIWDNVDSGVRCIDPIVNQFDYYSVDHLNTAEIRLIPRVVIQDFYPGYITISGQYSDGIYHVNPTTGHSFKTSIREDIAKQYRFFQSWGMAKISDDELIVGETRQLFYYKKGMQTLQPFYLQPKHQYATLKDIKLDAQRNLWVSSLNDDLWRIDLKTNALESKQALPSKGKFINTFIDSRKNIWGGISDGHAVIPKGQGEPISFTIKRDAQSTYYISENFCECPNGEIWLAGNEEGIGLLSAEHPERGIIKRFKLNDASNNNAVIRAFRVACNAQNDLWILGNNNLWKVDRSGKHHIDYSFEYGIEDISGIFQFLDDGNLLIGGRGGIYIIDTESLKSNKLPPKPYIYKIKTSKEERNDISTFLRRDRLTFSPLENTLTIEFAAINYTLPKEIEFRYRLVGGEENWNDPGKNRSITYSNLKGGDYVFQLKAANNEGIWSEEVYELPIFIGTPWYKTTMFYLALGALLSGLVVSAYRYRINEIRKEDSLQAAFEKQIANVEMNALRAQMNPHFIFNCLNSIDRYIIKNDTKKASKYLNNFGRLIRLILQNSRSNYVNLLDELEALELYIKLEQMRLRNSFDYEINIQDNLNPENFEIPPMLIQPYVENAIWHGLYHEKEKKGNVKITVSIKNDMLICIVEDNGIGRVASRKMLNNKEIKRKSMGMSITAERISIINHLYDTNNNVEIIDLYDQHNNALGTRVILNISL